MNGLVVVKTTEDIITYGVSIRVYDISTTPNDNSIFFLQDLTSEISSGISIWDPDDVAVSLFN